MNSPFYKYDMHSHSYWSDGDASIKELVKRARAVGLKIFILTDHAAIKGWNEFKDACDKHGITTFPGAEITVLCETVWFDILLYGFDPADSKLLELLARHESALRKVSARYLDYLHGLGTEIMWDNIINHFSIPLLTVPSLYYVNRFRNLIHGIGYQQIGQDVKNACLRLIDRGDIYQNHLPRIDDVIEAVTESGGIASLAHPIKSASFLSRLIKKDAAICLKMLLGYAISHNIHAIEIRHSNHTKDDENLLKLFARRNGLLMTGGSDYHGDMPGEHKVDVHLGCPGLTEDEFKTIRAKLSW